MRREGVGLPNPKFGLPNSKIGLPNPKFEVLRWVGDFGGGVFGQKAENG